MTSLMASWHGSLAVLGAACGLGAFAVLAAALHPYTTWCSFGVSADDLNYSALKQINRSNVTKPQVAWTYDTGDQVAYGFAPIVVDRIWYGAAKNGSLVAMDATDGKELWVYRFPPSAAGGAGRVA